MRERGRAMARGVAAVCAAGSLSGGCAVNELPHPDEDNRPPLARAGADRVVAVGTTVELDGLESSDPEADPLVYRWHLMEVPVESRAQLERLDAAVTRFVADQPGSYRVRLVVSDELLDSSSDVAVIRAVADAPGSEPDASAPAASDDVEAGR